MTKEIEKIADWLKEQQRDFRHHWRSLDDKRKVWEQSGDKEKYIKLQELYEFLNQPRIIYTEDRSKQKEYTLQTVNVEIDGLSVIDDMAVNPLEHNSFSLSDSYKPEDLEHTVILTGTLGGFSWNGYNPKPCYESVRKILDKTLTRWGAERVAKKYATELAEKIADALGGKLMLSTKY